tara:strand:+ start:183 stop:1115 length:933 start_codon:yes stop_codon:yes gene_type:complete
MKKILKRLDLKKLIIINIFLTIFLGLALGIHFRIPPFNILKDKVLKPLLVTSEVKIDREVELKIREFWKKTTEENNNIDLYGGIDWKKYIYWIEEIKKGGYILMFRHAEREKWGEALGGFDAYELYNKLDARDYDWYRATCLTERGIETAKNTGRAFKHGGIKIQSVISSPSCRARETAFYSFGRIDEIHSSLLHKTGIHPFDRYKFGKDLRKTIFNFDLDNDKNLVLSAHNSVIDFKGLIDEFNVPIKDNDPPGLEETGFYVIEKKGTKLIVRHKFYKSSEFNMLMYRQSPLKKRCSNPTSPQTGCRSM